MEFFQIQVSRREETGKGPIRRLRGEGLVPGILYGLGRPNLPLKIPTGELTRFLDNPSHLVELHMGDKARQAIVREVQVDPLTDAILHVDFHRVEEGAEVEDHVRIVYKGTAIGTTKGGVFQALEEALFIRSTPRDLPAEFLVDVAHLEFGDAVLARDVALPKGVTLLTAEETILAQVAAPKRVAVEEEPEAAAAEGAEGAEATDEAAAAPAAGGEEGGA